LEFDRLIMAWHRSSEASKRLDEIPGVGPALATALVAQAVHDRRPAVIRYASLIARVSEGCATLQRSAARVNAPRHFGSVADQGARNRACQQDRTNGLGHERVSSPRCQR